jgi:hypothetical protein
MDNEQIEKMLDIYLNAYAKGRVELMNKATDKYNNVPEMFRWAFIKPTWDIPKSYNTGELITINRYTWATSDIIK